jgi:uncharacterized protein YyaL (SSP411 family)
MPQTPLPTAQEGARGTQPPPANRLIRERSPYLLQHAHNPVDWYPWGAEALEKARREGKPVFLSIGYSTCHWCHVMERESFEDERTARLLNEHFVSIKVDREERPDLDLLYMAAVQAMAGQGGWPLSVFLTPDREPFFGGTYFPPEDRWGRPGFRTLLEDIAAVWSSTCPRVTGSAAQVAAFLRSQAETPAGDPPSPASLRTLLVQGADALKTSYDARHGGFGGAPKFPAPHNLGFLLRHVQRTGDVDALAMVVHTLDAMAAGGIHDHLGGGFHRYSTDADWLVPHFEKMLYDQAGLAQVYTDAYLVTRAPRHAETVRDILEYVMRDLAHPDGGFYSAEDADSEGEEGTFYVWRYGEIMAVLGPEAGKDFCSAFEVEPAGNWEGQSILRRPRPAGPADSSIGSQTEAPDGIVPAPGAAAGPRPLSPTVQWARARLLEARSQRPRPHRDEKVIAAWNGQMIAAFARAGRALAEPRYIAAAAQAASFVERQLWRDGRLLRHYRDGQAAALGCLDDHAFMGLAYVALHEATRHNACLAAAVDIARKLLQNFAQPSGALAYVGLDAEELIAPVFDVQDGALPSSTSAAVLLLLKLGRLARQPEWTAAAEAAVRANHERLMQSPAAHAAFLSAVDFALVLDSGRRGSTTTLHLPT